jgi:hypothetical protein
MICVVKSSVVEPSCSTGIILSCAVFKMTLKPLISEDSRLIGLSLDGIVVS